MSPKVIIRQNSILVDRDTLEPIQEEIDTLRKQINKEEKESRVEELQQKLKELAANASPMIDLRGKIYVFLEPPDPELWKIIKPIMSHDSFITEHPFVDSNSFQGIHVKSIITKGWPTFIFCTAKDESKWEQWDEIVSRSLIMSPNMSPKKYRGSTILSAQQNGLPTAIQELLIRSKREVDLARKCMLYLKNSITEATTLKREEGNSSESHDFIYKNPVWIPYQEILGATLPAERGTDMRINRHIHLLLRVIALAKTNQRYQVIFDNQTLTIAAPEDLTEALYIMQNSSGLPPYKVKFFNEIFFPLYKKKLNEKLREQEQFRRNIIIEGEDKKFDNAIVVQAASAVILTANEVCDYYNLRNPKAPINSDNLRKKYLNELVSAGWVEALDLHDGNTKKVYYPIIVPIEEQEATSQTITPESNESNTYPEFYIQHKINVPIDYIPRSENWLNLQVLALWRCGIDKANEHRSSSLSCYNNNNSSKEQAEKPIVAAIQFLDKERKVEYIVNDGNTSDTNYNDRKKITMTEFVRKYDGSTGKLSRHFSRPIFANSYNNIFGKIKYLGVISHSKEQTQEIFKIPEFPEKDDIS